MCKILLPLFARTLIDLKLKTVETNWLRARQGPHRGAKGLANG